MTRGVWYRCERCEDILDIYGKYAGRFPLAYSEDVRDGVTVYFCRGCTLAMYPLCETVWVTFPPGTQEDLTLADQVPG